MERNEHLSTLSRQRYENDASSGGQRFETGHFLAPRTVLEVGIDDSIFYFHFLDREVCFS